jgi:hypothetical protein
MHLAFSMFCIERQTASLCRRLLQSAITSAGSYPALLCVGGFPASDFTAIPVNSGSSDYYGSFVTLGNIQDLVSQRFYSPTFGRFPLGNPHLVIERWAFYAVGRDFRRFPLSCGFSLFRVSHGNACKNRFRRNTGRSAACEVRLRRYLQVCQGAHYPRPPAIFSSNTAIVLMHKFLSLRVL